MKKLKTCRRNFLKERHLTVTLRNYSIGTVKNKLTLELRDPKLLYSKDKKINYTGEV
jgi:hypothetical protein